MKPGRFLLVVLYMGYLVNAGLMLMLLPWSRAWGLLLTRFPHSASSVLDAPTIRGTLSAFGLLHLVLVLWELVNPTLLMSTSKPQRESQKQDRS